MKIRLLLFSIVISVQVMAQRQKTEISVDNKNCLCSEVGEKKRPPLAYPLEHITKYNLFSKIISWKLAGGENTFEELFYINYNSNRNTTGSQVGKVFNLIAGNPILLNHPQDSIGINLTPCKAKFYDFDVNVTTNYPVSRWVRNFDFESEFDNYTQSYIDILCAKVGYSEGLLRQVFETKTEDEIKKLIAKMNKKYKTDVLYDQNRGYIDYISVVLEEKRIPFEQFLGEIVIKTDDRTRPINEIEKQRLNDIFFPFVMKNAVAEVQELITPTVMLLKSKAEYISFVINSEMLHKPNENKSKVSTEIFTLIDNFSFTTKDGLALDIKEICLPQSEIAGTGVEIAYNGANVGFINSSRLVIADGANISIPSKKINAEVKNLQINNKRVSGEIVLSSNEISNYLKSQGFKINSDNEKIYFEKTVK